jgi:hypothetical protein
LHPTGRARFPGYTPLPEKVPGRKFVALNRGVPSGVISRTLYSTYKVFFYIKGRFPA